MNEGLYGLMILVAFSRWRWWEFEMRRISWYWCQTHFPV